MHTLCTYNGRPNKIPSHTIISIMSFSMNQFITSEVINSMGTLIEIGK